MGAVEEGVEDPHLELLGVPRALEGAGRVDRVVQQEVQLTPHQGRRDEEEEEVEETRHQLLLEQVDRVLSSSHILKAKSYPDTNERTL
jgi:hypothetical protein